MDNHSMVLSNRVILNRIKKGKDCSSLTDAYDMKTRFNGRVLD